MTYLSPFTPLFFPDIASDGVPCRCMQVFAPGDVILIELFSDDDVEAWLVSDADGSSVAITFAAEDLDDGGALFYAQVSGLADGVYWLHVEGLGDSEPFEVTSSQAVLDSTSLFQYGNADNRRRKDARFIVDGKRLFFSFRAIGGFKDSGVSFAVDNEQFETPDSDIVELYGKESSQKKFTLGSGDGAPIWQGELLNRLLCCQYVYIDGLRYARKGSAVPEITALMDGLDAFVFTQNLQRINYNYPKYSDIENG